MKYYKVQSLCRRQLNNFKFQKKDYNTLHIFGEGWTGALGRGTSMMLSSHPDTMNDILKESHHPQFCQIDNIAAGWGHTVIINTDKVYLTGRPYDFVNLLRLNRMPPIIRRLNINQALYMERDCDSMDKGFFGNAVDIIFRRGHDGEEYYRGTFPDFVSFELPNGESPKKTIDKSGVKIPQANKTLAASAGLTAIIGSSGRLYTFGLNQRGQCGVGDKDAHHIWKPTPVVMKEENGTIFRSSDHEAFLENVKSVDLGLQNGLALDNQGKLYGFGKGARGQLGITGFESFNDDEEVEARESATDLEYKAIPINDFRVTDYSLNSDDARVKQMSAGWNHSAAITESNHAFIWGKNAGVESNGSTLRAIDSPSPTFVEGLPHNIEIRHVSCGSHHTAFLMADNSVYVVGIATDTIRPIGQNAVQVIPPCIIDSPIKQFTSHFDRTTIVAGEFGHQVLEFQLWSSEDLRSKCVFEPEWVQILFKHDIRGIQQVEKGWLHTVIVST